MALGFNVCSLFLNCKRQVFRISCLCCPALLQLWPDCVFLVLRMKTHFIYNRCCLACRNHFVLHWFLKGKLWSAKNNCRNSPLFISLLSLTGRNFSGILCSGGIGDVPDQFVCSSGLPDHFWNQLVARCGCFPWIHERLCGWVLQDALCSWVDGSDTMTAFWAVLPLQLCVELLVPLQFWLGLT